MYNPRDGKKVSILLATEPQKTGRECFFNPIAFLSYNSTSTIEDLKFLVLFLAIDC